MAFYCIDYINGSDTTGDGSAVAPWKTIGYGQSQVTLAFGDEFRIHGGPEPTLLDTAAFRTTGPSYTITTSIDLTGSLAANDYIFVQDFYRAFRISAINSTTITLYSNVAVNPSFLGNGVTFSIWKAGGVPVTINANTDALETFCTAASPFTINTDSVIISGGWNNTFDAKTSFGRTFFYRTSSTSFNMNNSVLGNLYKTNDTTGYVIKDMHISGSGLANFITYSTGSPYSNGNAKFDNLVLTSIGSGMLVNNHSFTDDFYLTNSTIVHSTWSLTYLTLINNILSNFTGIFKLNGLTQVFLGRGTQSALTSFRAATAGPSDFKMEWGNTTYINQYNPTLWGADQARIPSLFNMSSLPTNDNYGNYIKIDSLTIQENPIQLYSSYSTSFAMVSSYIELDATNLAKLAYVGKTGLNFGQLTIKAPGSPFDTASGMVVAADQDNISLSNNLQPIKWIDTVNNRDWYINNQSVSYLDTVNYVTGTNSIATRPTSIGTVGNVYGTYIPAGISFYKKDSETATITVKMKLLGSTSYTAAIGLISSAQQLVYTGFPQNQSISGDQLRLSGNQDASTAEWRDVVYTLPATTNLNADMTAGYFFLIGEGEGGSNLAEAGKWLLIDSVTITIS